MKISILGVGAYGIALAKVFYENDNKVSMWTKFEEEADIVKLKRENVNCFPGVKIPKQIDITTNLMECINESKIIVIAVPMQAVREVSREVAKYLKEEQVICIASKGIDVNTNKFISDLAVDLGINNISYISGPTFAHELASLNKIENIAPK